MILIEYDPAKTRYEVLVDYAYRNMDPFDGAGQFCDKGSSYYPAIFYETEEELATAESVLAQILEEYPDWKEEDIAAPILERPKFWTGTLEKCTLCVVHRTSSESKAEFIVDSILSCLFSITVYCTTRQRRNIIRIFTSKTQAITDITRMPAEDPSD